MEGEPAGPRVGGGSRIGSSRNWSGAVILPRHGKRFVQVIARWTVPRITDGEGLGPFACSHWIGVDGLRRWMKSMPQMGTAQHLGRVVPGGPVESHFAWRQWWLRGGGKTHTPVPIGPALSPGQAVYCCVTLLPRNLPAPGNEDWAHFFLRIVGNPKAYAAVSSPPAKPNDREVRATGASAQWIVERPTALEPSPGGAVKAGDNYPLPNFGECTADRFAAVLAESPAAIDLADPAADPEDERRAALRTPRKLRMIERFDNPSRIEVIAKPTEAKGDRITVRYVRR
jgi:hypothetical protein